MMGEKERERNMVRAQAALTRFRSLTPMLTGFLRGITGDKKIRLQAGTSTYTTKDSVFIAPPIGLGANYRHPSRRVCGTRDTDGLPVCEGCRAWEEVFVSLLHEMSHVAFTRIESEEFRAAYASALPTAASILGVTRTIEPKAENAKKVDPYFPMVANSLEDVRVDSAMVAARPGVAAMQRASYATIMSGTLEIVSSDGDTRIIDWAEVDATAQVIVSAISFGLGYGVHRSMKPEVVDFFSREDVIRTCSEVAGTDLKTVIIRSAELIKLGRDAGFFPLDEDGEAGGAGEGQDGDGAGAGVPQDVLEHVKAAEAHKHDSDGSEARERAGHPDAGGGREQAELQEALGAVLRQDGWVDEPSAQFGGVDYAVWDRASHGDCGQKPSETVLGPTLGKLRAVLAPNQLSRHTRHIRAGRLDPRVLGRRAPVEDDRLFMRKQTNTARDFFFVLGLDVSGSTGMDAGDGSGRRVIDVLVSAAWAQAELLNRLGVPFTIVTHTTGDGWDHDIMVELREVKGPDEPWNKVSQDRLRSLRPVSGNLDARAMVGFRKIAESHRAKEKFIIQYSDGEFPVMNHDDERAVIAREIEIHRRTPDLHFMMVGIQSSSPAQFGFDFVRVDNESETMKVVNQIERAVK